MYIEGLFHIVYNKELFCNENMVFDKFSSLYIFL